MNSAHLIPVIKKAEAVFASYDIQLAVPLFTALGYKGFGRHGEKFADPYNLPFTYNDAAFPIAAFTAHLAFKGFHHVLIISFTFQSTGSLTRRLSLFVRYIRCPFFRP